MDKNTVLAFLVIALILMGMPYYYEMIGLAPPPPQETVKKRVLRLIRHLPPVPRPLLLRIHLFTEEALLKDLLKTRS